MIFNKTIRLEEWGLSESLYSAPFLGKRESISDCFSRMPASADMTI